MSEVLRSPLHQNYYSSDRLLATLTALGPLNQKARSGANKNSCQISTDIGRQVNNGSAEDQFSITKTTSAESRLRMAKFVAYLRGSRPSL